MTGVLSTALEALAAGACPIRGMTDGSKRPFGQWSEWQDKRPDRVLVHQWFKGGHPALGIVCGEVSGRLECLEIEGRAMGMWGPLKDRMAAAGLLDLLIEVARGYSEASPSGGVHFLYRIGGESEMPGNTKLASRVVQGVVQVESMIETRGEGGFIMVAPSNGATHPSGKPWQMMTGGWDTVTTITREQRDALVRICESFDEMPPMVVPPAPRVVATRTPGGSGWVDAALTEWDQANPIESVLQRNGWQYLESDGLGQLWRRPGKDRGSCSGRVNLNSRLHVFSTSTPFTAGQRHATTYDALDVELTYRLGRPPTSDERVAILRAETSAAPSDDYSWVTVTDRPAVAPPANQSDTNGAPSTAGVQHQEVVATSVANIPDEFWDARPLFRQIRTAAHSVFRAPDGLLGTLIPRIAATIPKTMLLPAIEGALGTLDYISMLVAPSGGGKSSTMALAADLMSNMPDYPRLQFDLPLGSGEGMAQRLFELREEKLDGKTVKRQVQVLDGIHYSVDEGSVLTQQAKREGTTIVQALCSAWSGGPFGQTNAKAETLRIVPRYSARITAVMGIQTTLANQILALLATGLPQRMTWFSMIDPKMPPPGSVTFGGYLDIDYLNANNWTARHSVRFAPEIWREVQAHAWGKNTGAVIDNPLDAHRWLLQEKTAFVFAVMDGRREVTVEDWELSRMVIEASRRVRNTILESAQIAARKVADTQVAKLVGQTLAIEDASVARAVDRGARAMGRVVARSEEPVTRRELHYAVASRDRKAASLDEMIEYAITRGWITDNGDGTYSKGDSTPQ